MIKQYEKARQKRRKRVLAAARKIIAEEGINALSMRKLARAADMVVNSLYNLFGSREDIFIALIEDGIDRQNEILMDAKIHDPLVLAEQIMITAIEQILKEESVYRPVYLASLHYGIHHFWGSGKAFAIGHDIFKKCIQHGYFRKGVITELLSEHILHGFRHTTELWACGEYDNDEYRTWSMYGFYICLLAVATDKGQKFISKPFKSVEKDLLEAGEIHRFQQKTKQ